MHQYHTVQCGLMLVVGYRSSAMLFVCVAWRGVAWRGVRGVAWRGVAWRGVAWRGVAWRGVAWRGVAWRGVAWRGVAWRGMAWRGVAWRDVAWRGVAWRDSCDLFTNTHYVLFNDAHCSISVIYRVQRQVLISINAVR